MSITDEINSYEINSYEINSYEINSYEYNKVYQLVFSSLLSIIIW